MTESRARGRARLGRLVFTVLLAAAAWCGMHCGARWAAERPLRGALTWAAASTLPQRLESGAFAVLWRPEQGGALEVVSADAPDRILWSTVPGRAFIQAALGEEKVSERRGMFSIRDYSRRRYVHQTVERLYAQDGAVRIEGRLYGRFHKQNAPYAMTFEARGAKQLGFKVEIDGRQANRVYLTYASEADEAFMGFGAQFTHFNLKGRRVPIFVMEQGIGRGEQPLTFLANLVAGAGGAWHTSYAVAPHYITSAMRSLFLETHEYAVFDLRAPECVQTTLFSNRMEGRVIAGDTPTELISEYAAVVGRMRPLPDWVLDGAVVGVQGGTEKARRVWSLLQEHETPVAAFWLQDWVGQRKTVVGKQLWWNWELDREHYPDWEGLLGEWAAQDIRVMTYVNPFLIDPSSKERYQRNLFREAAAQGYLIQNGQGEPYLVKNTDFSAALIDLSYPAAREWMKDVIKKQVIGAGASGWMADFGEALPYDAVLHSGESAARFHNRYPEEWARLNREAVEEAGRGNDAVFFMRSGYRESPRHASLFWLGDQMVSWDRYDGIKSALTGLLSSGLSGFAFNHSDIGGYTSVNTPLFSRTRDAELLKRWMELNAFTTVFRTHEGVDPDANHQFYADADTLAHFSRCARLYLAWAEYRKALVREAAETGVPVVRHPFIHYPQDPRVLAVSHEQFMVGTAFMIAPVLDPGKKSVSCYLPDGKWTHVWSGQEFDAEDKGLEVVVDAPLGEPGVFYQTGAPEAADFMDNLRRLDVLAPRRD